MLTTVKIRRVTECHRKICPIVRCNYTLGTDHWVRGTNFWFKIWWFSTWNKLRYELRRFSDRPDFLNILWNSGEKSRTDWKVSFLFFPFWNTYRTTYLPSTPDQQKFRHKILTNEIVSQTVPYSSTGNGLALHSDNHLELNPNPYLEKSYSLLRNYPYLGIVMYKINNISKWIFDHNLWYIRKSWFLAFLNSVSENRMENFFYDFSRWKNDLVSKKF